MFITDAKSFYFGSISGHPRNRVGCWTTCKIWKVYAKTCAWWLIFSSSTAAQREFLWIFVHIKKKEHISLYDLGESHLLKYRLEKYKLYRIYSIRKKSIHFGEAFKSDTRFFEKENKFTVLSPLWDHIKRWSSCYSKNKIKSDREQSLIREGGVYWFYYLLWSFSFSFVYPQYQKIKL